MTNKMRTTYVSSIIVLLVLTAASIALRTYSMLTGFDVTTGSFDPTAYRGAWLILLAVTVIATIIPLIMLRKMDGLRVLYNDIPTIFSSAFMCVALVAYAIHTVIATVNGTHSGVALVFSIISAVLGLAAICYFATNLITRPFSEGARSTFAVINVLFSCMLAFFLYTENEMFVTSPIKILHIASVMMAAFFFLGECRIALNRAFWGLYVVVALIAFILTATDAASCLIYIPVSGTEEIGSSAYCFLLLAFALYIFSRLLSVYLVNCKDARGLLAVFEASTGRYEKDKEDEEPEQLHMELDEKKEDAESNA